MVGGVLEMEKVANGGRTVSASRLTRIFRLIKQRTENHLQMMHLVKWIRGDNHWDDSLVSQQFHDVTRCHSLGYGFPRRDRHNVRCRPNIRVDCPLCVGILLQIKRGNHNARDGRSWFFLGYSQRFASEVASCALELANP